jgi:hypothetical protein
MCIFRYSVWKHREGDYAFLNCGETKQAHDVSLQFEIIDLPQILDNLQIKNLAAHPETATEYGLIVQWTMRSSWHTTRIILPSYASAYSCGAPE